MGDRVKHIFSGIGLIIGLAGTPLLAQADFLVKTVVLSKDVKREPHREYSCLRPIAKKIKTGKRPFQRFKLQKPPT